MSMHDIFKRERKNVGLFSSKFENWFKEEALNDGVIMGGHKKREAKGMMKKKVKE